jgi:hypothetical protein
MEKYMSALEPVSPEDLERLNQLQIAKRGIADRLLALEEEKVRILAASKRVSDEWDGVFARLAQERGLDPSSHLDINPKNGALQVIGQQPPAPVPAPQPAAEEAPAEDASQAEAPAEES